MPRILEGLAARLQVPKGARDVLVFDEVVPGFFLRKFQSGRASYGVKYNVGKQQRRISLGPAAPGVLREMRKKASDILARARLGQDVVGEKRSAANVRNYTLGEIVPKYLDARRGSLRPKSHFEATRYLKRSWAPLHDLPINQITRKAVIQVVDDLECNSGKVSADRARVALSGLFGWAIDRGYLETNPTTNIRSRSEKGSRERVLSESELLEVWQACEGADEYGSIVRLLILTGQRRAEIGDLAWSEVDMEKRQIDLPERRTKNGRPHIVPLSDEAMIVLKHVPRSSDREYMFGRGVGGFGGWSKSKAELDARIAMARTRGTTNTQMPNWTLHDLRRSFVTHVSERGFAPPHVVEAIVNHISGAKAGIAGVYNRASYLVDKRRALELWGAHFAGQLGGQQRA